MSDSYYNAPGAAVSDNIREFLVQQQLRKHQELQDRLSIQDREIAVQREGRLAQSDNADLEMRRLLLDEKKQEAAEKIKQQKQDKFLKRVGTYVPGDIPSAEDVTDAKALGFEHLFPDPIKGAEEFAKSPVEFQGPMEGSAERPPSPAPAPPMRVFVGTPQQREKQRVEGERDKYVASLPNGEAKDAALFRIHTGANEPAGAFKANDPPKPDSRSAVLQAADVLIKGGMEPYAALQKAAHDIGTADDRPRQGPALGTGGVPVSTLRRLDALRNQYTNLDSTKEMRKVLQAQDFANTLDVNTKNPADDQALIYAFAKAMDPGSTVREGEYKTVQTYAQSWADQFKFKADRIFSNSPFLTTEARANMKQVIKQKYESYKRGHDRLRGEYANQINGVTGDANGDTYLIDFGMETPPPLPNATGVIAPAKLPNTPTSGTGKPSAADLIKKYGVKQ